MEKIQKELNEISWNVTEEVYRDDPALSYSTLARYEREGFDKLDSLFDQISTPSLTQGSMVDALITGGEEEFNDRFYVADFPSLGDKEQQIADLLFESHHETCAGFSAIPKNDIIAAANQVVYYKNYTDPVRVKKLTEACSQYYNLKYLAGDKEIVSANTYAKVLAMVNALKESPATMRYFMPDEPFSNIKRYYQLKFKATLEGIDYRCMADLIIVSYDTKDIFLIDLKTSGKSEWNFPKSFIEWLYAQQGRLYYRIIEDNLKRDDYFKDFKIHNYRFIVINKDKLTPLVWEYTDTKKYGELTYGKNQQIVVRDPFVIGKELQHYLDNRPRVPIGIDEEGINDIVSVLNQL